HALAIRELDANWAVDVPRCGDAALAAARLIRREAMTTFTAPEQRVVGLLHLPGDDAVLVVDGPRAATRAVHAVCAAEYVIMLPAVAVKLFPPTCFWIYKVLNPTHSFLNLP